MTQHKWRNSKTTLKHKTFCQLVFRKLFRNAEHFHTLPYSQGAHKCTVHFKLRNVRLPKFFVAFSQIILTLLRIPFFRSENINWQERLQTGLMSREVVIWTPCFMWVSVQYFENMPLNMSSDLSIPVLVACLWAFWSEVVPINRRLAWTQYMPISKFDHGRNLTVNNILWKVFKFWLTV
jgi:hypothetical protein